MFPQQEHIRVTQLNKPKDSSDRGLKEGSVQPESPTQQDVLKGLADSHTVYFHSHSRHPLFLVCTQFMTDSNQEFEAERKLNTEVAQGLMHCLKWPFNI